MFLNTLHEVVGMLLYLQYTNLDKSSHSANQDIKFVELSPFLPLTIYIFFNFVFNNPSEH